MVTLRLAAVVKLFYKLFKCVLGMSRCRIYKRFVVLTCCNEKQLEQYLDKFKFWKKKVSIKPVLFAMRMWNFI